jgi:calcineurin-like phosphoesterase family protein/purple acid phosphatase-like protein
MNQACSKLPAVLALTFLLCVLSTQAQPAIFIPTNAVWRYLDDGSDQGFSWIAPEFEDSDWPSGPAELGYGDAEDGRPEATMVSYGPDPDFKYITTYFRHTFLVTNAASVTNLIARLLRDDGAIVYLNGQEAFRSRMPDGFVDFFTQADFPGVSGSDEVTFFTYAIDPALLVEGNNVIAVEIHQVDWADPDISFDLELIGERGEPPPPRLVRGPYLQTGTPSSVIVKWRTDRPAESIVLYGRAPDDLHLLMGDLNKTTEHQVRVTGLSPATKYFYAVGDLKDTFAAGPDHFFVTQPTAGRARPTRIWALGDCGTAAQGYPGSRLVRDAYYRFAGTNSTDVWLMLGDNAYNSGTDDEYRRAVFEVYHEMLRNTVLWSTLGNHETYGPGFEGRFAYHNIFSLPESGEAGGMRSGTENYYSFDHANIHFVCLDSEESDRSPSGPMLAWLEEDLAANTNDWLVAFWHSPPYTKGSHDSDNPIDSAGRMNQMRTNVVPVLEAHGVDLILCGHSHSYERSYLLNGHYGYSPTLTSSMIKDAGNGRTNGTGAYLKTSTGPTPNAGAIYVVAGSSGWATQLQPRNHPAMFVTLLRMGSMVIDINGNRLDARFLRETGAIDDYFTIIKGAAPEAFRFSTFHVANGKVIGSWKSVAGANYRIDRASSLEAPDWTPVDGMPIIATGATTFWTNTLPADAKSFYRVVKVADD